MLQRIQTLFLLIAITAISLSFVFPIAKIQTGDEVTALYTNYGLKSIDGPGKSHIMESGFIFIVAAVLTPPDVISQFLMAGPLLVLYGISILVVKVSMKSRARSESTEETVESHSG